MFEVITFASDNTLILYNYKFSIRNFCISKDVNLQVNKSARN